MLGSVNLQQEVIFNTVEVKIDEDMAEELHHEFDEPEKHFRFSNACVETGCHQWKGGECSVINSIIQLNAMQQFPEHLPNCLIRSTCRWFYQRGSAACSLCSYIITDALDNIVPSSQTSYTD
jgi:hypothetical protein